MTEGYRPRPRLYVHMGTVLADNSGADGEPPDNDGMDARVANLEAFAADAKQRLTRVETKLDHIEKEVSQFKWWIVAQIVAGILAVLGTGIAIQQMTVTTFEAAAKASASGTAQPIVIQIPASPQAPPPVPAPTPAPAK